MDEIDEKLALFMSIMENHNDRINKNTDLLKECLRLIAELWKQIDKLEKDIKL